MVSTRNRSWERSRQILKRLTVVGMTLCGKDNFVSKTTFATAHLVFEIFVQIQFV